MAKLSQMISCLILTTALWLAGTATCPTLQSRKLQAPDPQPSKAHESVCSLSRAFTRTFPGPALGSVGERTNTAPAPQSPQARQGADGAGDLGEQHSEVALGAQRCRPALAGRECVPVGVCRTRESWHTALCLSVA